ncbi:MAG: DNA polymerase III subunit gamma/tau [Acaryochloris sp. CRU_2_0]|nr:DNA polymerase III subunit gamma/tau [Acaryochloris sp. CRU_2_0]
MAYEPLHHKYRPQVFADLVGQDAIATTLTNAICSQRIAPAYLFTGPRGTGKTSSARILAKSLNCLSSEKPTPMPCGTCNVCQEVTKGNSLDVIEIDAASNTGVDNIRDLIEKAQFAPVQCRFKIYCLDEVHMLSTAAFNALLKTLEEPPDRIVFILATTDPQRVLPTIISRCQRFDFRRIALAAMVQHLAHIAEVENIAITPTAIELIAQIAQGGLRDAESLLDQLSLLTGEIDNTQVWDLVGVVPEQALLALLQAIVAGQPALIVEQTQTLLNRGREPLGVLQNLAGFYRDLLIAKTAPQRRDLVAVTASTWAALTQMAQHFALEQILAGQQHLRSCEAQIKNSTQPRLWLEVTLLGLLPGATLSQLAPRPVQRQPPTSALEPTPQILATPATEIIAKDLESVVAVDVSNAKPQELTIKTTEIQTPKQPLAESVVDDQTEKITMDGVICTHSQLDSMGESVSVNASSAQKHSPSPLPLPQKAESVPQEPAPSPESFDLEEVWRQVLDKLNPAGQALFREHGQLLSWQGREVRIGIRKSLLKIAQPKVAEVENTFLRCFSQKVKVTLDILTPEQLKSKTAQSAPKSTSLTQKSASTTLRPALNHPPQDTLNSISSEPQLAQPAIADGQQQKGSDGEVQTLEPPSWQNKDETAIAAHSFAQFSMVP